MITQTELKKQITLCQGAKNDGDYYDELDKYALLGYLHALLYVDGKLKAKYKGGV